MLKRCAVSMTFILCVAAAVSGHEGKAHIIGTVTAFDANHVTLQTPDGKTVTIGITKDTRYLKGESAASASDMKVGQRIVIDISGQGRQATASEIRLGTQGTGHEMKHSSH